MVLPAAKRRLQLRVICGATARSTLDPFMRGTRERLEAANTGCTSTLMASGGYKSGGTHVLETARLVPVLGMRLQMHCPNRALLVHFREWGFICSLQTAPRKLRAPVTARPAEFIGGSARQGHMHGHQPGRSQADRGVRPLLPARPKSRSTHQPPPKRH